MSTFTQIYGNATPNKFQIAASMVGGFSTFGYGAAIIVLRAPSQEVGSTARVFLSSHSSDSDGMRGSFQAGDIFAYWRTSGTSAAVKVVDTYVPGELYVIGIHAETNGLQRFTVNGVVHPTTIDMSGGVTLRGASNMLPWIQGINLEDFDFEVSDVAFWLSNDSADIPTFEEIQNYQAGQPMLTASAATKIHLKAVGTAGAFATQFTDQFGANHAIHIAGDMEDLNENQPRFVSVASFTAGQIAPASTVVQVSYENSITGTVYMTVGLATANITNPTGAQIKAQLNQNGTAATAYASYVESTPGARSRQIPGILASVNYKAFAVIETSPGVFSEVLSWTFTSPRIGVLSPEIYAPGSPQVLYASQSAIDYSVAAPNLTSILGTTSTGSNGVMTIDLSAGPNRFLPVNSEVKLGWQKGDFSGYASRNIVNLDA
jgi:hypothetical protein